MSYEDPNRLKGKQIRFNVETYKLFFQEMKLHQDPISLYQKENEHIVLGTVPMMKIDDSIEHPGWDTKTKQEIRADFHQPAEIINELIMLTEAWKI